MASYGEALDKAGTCDDPLVSELLAAKEMLNSPGGAHPDIFQLLRVMVERGASDLHVKVGSPPGLRIDGVMSPLGRKPLRPEDTLMQVRDLLTDDQFDRFTAEGDLDVSYSMPDLSRFRVNAMVQRGSMGLVVRRIPEDVPTLADLDFPLTVEHLAERPRGLVLVTGPTGSGKSTTLAAMVNHVNETRAGHIVTMEDPIEFIHRDKQCWVTQREIGHDSKDFPNALRRALRQDPDVIMVGEMRDLETIALAVTAAETGHLVFGTLHTTSAIQTVGRIVDVFGSAQQSQIRMQLADNLQGIISQTLVPRTSRGRVPALEILVATDAVRALIREAKTPQILNLMQTGAKDGMQTLESALNQLVAMREISYDTAVRRANFPNLIRDPELPEPRRELSPRPYHSTQS